MGIAVSSLRIERDSGQLLAQVGRSTGMFVTSIVPDCSLPQSEQQRGESVAATRTRMIQDKFSGLEEYLVLQQVDREKDRRPTPETELGLHTTYVRTVHRMHLSPMFELPDDI